MRKTLLVAALPLALFATPASAQEPAPAEEYDAAQHIAVTKAEVLEMMDRMPAAEGVVFRPRTQPYRPYRWSSVADAPEIADSIARHARTRLEAALLVVYGCFESALQKSVAGDFREGAFHSFGYLQIGDKRLRPAAATNVDLATETWLALLDKSRAECASRPADEQATEIGSGNCQAGRELARRRMRLARAIAGSPETVALP